MLLTSGRLFAPALFLASSLLVVGAAEVAGHPAKDKEKIKDKGPGKDKDKGFGKDKEKGADKAAKDLRKAFTAISDLSQGPVAGKESARVLDHAARFYREAVRAFPDDPRRAGELAVAAKDAVRGLEHLRRSSARPVPGLPEPPTVFGRAFAGPKGKGPPPADAGPDADRGPRTEALTALTNARERLSWSDPGAQGSGPARDIFDAARTAYADARAAYDSGEYRKAAELARAAETWSHVPEHLARAGGDLAGGPAVAPEPKKKGPPAPPPLAPEPKRKGPAAPPPPPPPPIKD